MTKCSTTEQDFLSAFFAAAKEEPDMCFADSVSVFMKRRSLGGLSLAVANELFTCEGDIKASQEHIRTVAEHAMASRRTSSLQTGWHVSTNSLSIIERIDCGLKRARQL